MKRQCALLTLTFLVSCAPIWADDSAPNWPRFRGPEGTGVAANATFPDTWSATENVEWKTDIPGRGWSSPIVWGDKLFLTTCAGPGQGDAPKKGLYFGGEKPAENAELEWKVLCLELSTGKVLWEKTVHKGVPPMPVHQKNSYASETPVTDGERVYACFGNLGIYCFDFEGNEVWKHPLTPVTMRFGWGPASSPVLHGDRLYYVNDNDDDDGSHLLALDKRTGQQIFRTEREEERSNWSTPYVWDNGTRAEIITAGTKANRAYDLDGNLLWTLKGMSTITIAAPYAVDGLLYITSGYVGDKHRPVYAIKPGATGDISLAEGATTNDFIVWSHPQIAPYNPSTLVHGGRLFSLYDRGMVSCFDAKTGAEFYKTEKLEGSGGFTVSPWAAGDKIYCLDEDGACFVLQSGETFNLLHTNRLAEDDMCMATPAVAGDRLIIRTLARVYSIRKPA